jgi:hypothetical protein
LVQRFWFCRSACDAQAPRLRLCFRVRASVLNPFTDGKIMVDQDCFRRAIRAALLGRQLFRAGKFIGFPWN